MQSLFGQVYILFYVQCRLLTLVIYAFCFLFYVYYGGLLTSSMTVLEPPPKINSFYDILSNNV